jgi:hypothetical protein
VRSIQSQSTPCAIARRTRGSASCGFAQLKASRRQFALSRRLTAIPATLASSPI